MSRAARGAHPIGRLVLAAVVAIAVASPPGTGSAVAGGGGSGSAPGGTIYFHRITSPLDTLAVSPDGSGLRATGCMGDRTMTLPRRVLRLEATGVTFPVPRSDGSVWLRDEARLVSTDDACGDRQVLAELPARTAATSASWSLDGTRVAVAALTYDETGVLLRQGIWVGEVGGGCGAPLCGLHLAVALPMTPVAGPTRYYGHELPPPRWSSDGRRVVFARAVSQPGPDSTGIFVGDLGLPGSTEVRSDVEVLVPGGVGYYPAFSPVAGDDRIAFARRVSTKSCFRNDVFLTTPAGGTAVRVGGTTNGMCQLTDPAWSPDGTWIAVSAWSGALADQPAVYRLKVDGTSKPVLVAASRSATYRIPAWRP